MAGAFDGLLQFTGQPGEQAQQQWSYDDPSTYWQQNLDPEYAKQLIAMMDEHAVANGGGSGYIDGYHVTGAPSYFRGESTSDEGIWDTNDQRQISRLLNDGSYYRDTWNPDGTYAGRVGDESGFVRLREGMKFPALIAGLMYGGAALNNAYGAGAGAGTGGMTAAEAAAAGTTDLGIGQGSLAAGGNGWTTVGSTVGSTGAGSTLADSARTIAGGLKDAFGNPLVQTAAGLALSRDVRGPVADPSLSTAIDRMTQTADDANARAQSNDEYWRTTFAPRYLQAMDDQITMGRELTDFNMGLARKYDARYWDTTARQQDAFYDHVNNYDSAAGRARIAGEAGTNADIQNAAALQALVRDLNRRGLNPNSGVVMSNMRQQAQQGALQKTMAINTAREAARKEGMNMRAVAAGLGGNLTGASAGFSGAAGQSSGLGLSGIQGANSGFNSSVGNWNATTGVGMNALNSVGNWGMNLTNGGTRANELNTLGWNQMLGYGLGMFGSGKGG